MLIIIYTKDFKDSFEIEASNLLQVVDYLKNNKQVLWEEVQKTELTYTLGALDPNIKPIKIYPNGITVDFGTYEILLIGDKVELSYAAAAAAVAYTAAYVAVGAGASLAAATAVSIAAYAITYVAISAAVSLAIGAIIQALSPTSSISNDPSASQKNMIFNGVPNVKEQGGSVPIILGNCIFGGVIISANMYSITDGLVGTIVAAGTGNDPVLVNVPANGDWYRVEL